MAFVFVFFTVALSLCVVGLVVLALAAILGSARDDRKSKNSGRNGAGPITDLQLLVPESAKPLRDAL
jgi:hypothetical protein